MRKSLDMPPMGWNSWDSYGAAVNEEQFLSNARILADTLLPYGYDTAVCDIQWYEPSAASNEYRRFARLCMDEYSRLIPAPNRFPSSKNGNGFRSIADRCHTLGLKFGIHIMRGIPRQAVHENRRILNTTATAADIAQPYSICPWNTDMYGVNAEADGAREYYDSLFEMYADWGVDFVKCDDIANTEMFKENPYSARREIELICGAIDRCGRDIILSLSPGPAPRSEESHLRDNSDMWRISGDFWDDWEKLYEMFGNCSLWQGVSDVGGFPDCDILPLARLCVNAPFLGEMGRMPRFTKDETLTMLTLWSIFRSPLFIGGELNSLEKNTYSLLTNREVLKMSRESRKARELFRREVGGKGEIAWLSESADFYYLAVFNTSDITTKTIISKAELPEFSEADVTDLWQGLTLPVSGRALKLSIPPHGVRLLKLKKVAGHGTGLKKLQ